MIEEIKKTAYIENVIFISFDLENCINLRNTLLESHNKWLIDDKEVNDDIIKILCDNKEEAEKLVDFGVDFITTNILE